MNESMIFLTPLLALLIVGALFGFTGCGVNLPLPDDPPVEEEKPKPPEKKPWEESVLTPPPTGGVGPLFPETYQDIVEASPGFAAYYPLNETGGNVAAVVGPLNPAANGTYTTAATAPPGSGYTLGNPGALSAKDPTDLSPSFNATAGYVEVGFQGALNPVKMAAGFTVELWVKPNPAAGGDTQVLISSHRFNAANNQQGYEIALVKVSGQANQQVRARIFNNTGTPGQAVIVPLQGDPAEWRQIVLTYRFDTTVGSQVGIYVRVAKSAGGFKDGPHGGVPYEPVVSGNPSTLRFGAGHGSGQSAVNFFGGQIDNVAFYNAVLDQNEIDKHFNMF